MVIRAVLLLFLTLLCACAGISTVTVGAVSEPIEAPQVQLFYSERPQCDFETVAWIFVPGEYLSQESVIRSMRYKAAQLGAPAVQVISLQKSGASNYRGTARALRCQG